MQPDRTRLLFGRNFTILKQTNVFLNFQVNVSDENVSLLQNIPEKVRSQSFEHF